MSGKTKLEKGKEEIEELLNKDVYTSDIAKILEVYVVTIYKYINKYCLQTKENPRRWELKLAGKDEQIINLLDAKVAIKAIAKTFRVHGNTLCKYLKKICPDI